MHNLTHLMAKVASARTKYFMENFNINRQKSCSLCRAEREEHQYAAWEYAPGQRAIIDAAEYAQLQKFFDSDEDEEPVFPEIEIESRSCPVLAYGVLIPQCDAVKRMWKVDMESFKYFSFGTLKDEQIYVSEFTDFVMFEENAVYDNHIPVALLLNTALDLTEEKEYGFGHTAFLLYEEMGILSNIVNRHFVLCIGEIEKDFDGTNDDHLDNWKDHIDTEKLIRIAQRLY